MEEDKQEVVQFSFVKKRANSVYNKTKKRGIIIPFFFFPSFIFLFFT